MRCDRMASAEVRPPYGTLEHRRRIRSALLVFEVPARNARVGRDDLLITVQRSNHELQIAISEDM